MSKWSDLSKIQMNEERRKKNNRIQKKKLEMSMAHWIELMMSSVSVIFDHNHYGVRMQNVIDNVVSQRTHSSYSIQRKQLEKGLEQQTDYDEFICIKFYYDVNNEKKR